MRLLGNFYPRLLQPRSAYIPRSAATPSRVCACAIRFVAGRRTLARWLVASADLERRLIWGPPTPEQHAHVLTADVNSGTGASKTGEPERKAGLVKVHRAGIYGQTPPSKENKFWD